MHLFAPTLAPPARRRLPPARGGSDANLRRAPGSVAIDSPGPEKLAPPVGGRVESLSEQALKTTPACCLGRKQNRRLEIAHLNYVGVWRTRQLSFVPDMPQQKEFLRVHSYK